MKNPQIPEGSFILDQIMNLNTNFHKLVLTPGSSYIKLTEWIAQKKAVITPKKDEQSFK